MADQPDVSVVVPCLNEEADVELLADRLFAAAGEAGLTTELIYVDDGSTDATSAVIDKLHALHGDAIVSVRHEENRGIPAAWKSRVAVARGSYVCFIDGDLQSPPRRWSRSTVVSSSRPTTWCRATARRSAVSATRVEYVPFLPCLRHATVADGVAEVPDLVVFDGANPLLATSPFGRVSDVHSLVALPSAVDGRPVPHPFQVFLVLADEHRRALVPPASVR